jgi:phage terminase large subunit-like protein
MAGRGWGKTRTGAEWIRQKVCSGQAGFIALIGKTPADCRDVMIEKKGGLLSVFPPHQRPVYQPSLRKVTFHNGAVAMTYGGSHPDMLRGPEHDCGWGDEPAAWQYPETMDMFRFGLRLGNKPQAIMTTTPRPTQLMKKLLYQVNNAGEILRDPAGNPYPNLRTAVSRGSTWENKNNLAETFLEDMTTTYEGTRLGRQELYAEMLTDTPGALWTQEMLDKCRYTPPFDGEKIIMPQFVLVVVAVDPAISDTDVSCETGIIVVALGIDGFGYVIEDCTSTGDPTKWGNAVDKAFHEHKADRATAEVNQGGDMVKYVMQTINNRIPVKKVHASRGKVARAQPVAALYEQGRIKHIGSHPKLEDQMTTWVPGDELCDRLDALVWGITDIFNLYDKKINTLPTITTRSVRKSNQYI